MKSRTCFYPLQEWLGIHEQPPVDYFLLLGLPRTMPLEPRQVRRAGEQQKAKLRPHASGPRHDAYQRLCREIDDAVRCLSHPRRGEAYYRQLVSGTLCSTSGPESGTRAAHERPESSAEADGETDPPSSSAGDASRWRIHESSESTTAGSHSSNPASVTSGPSDADSEGVAGQDMPLGEAPVPGQRPTTARADYELLAEVGRGSTSTVFEAYDRALRRYVAIKQLNERIASDPRQREMFWEEARFLANYRHPNIVSVYTVHADLGWIVMELMKGHTGHLQANGPLTADQVRSILQQALEGLKFLHDRERIHGELKPSSLLIDGEGRVKLSDSPGFSVGGEIRLPPAGQRHVAPELLRPDVFGPVGPAVDLYCLGYTLIELLAGPVFPYRFKGVEQGHASQELNWMRWHSAPSEQLPPIAELVPGAPDDLTRVIDRMVRKRTADRYASVDEVLQDLEVRPLVLLDLPQSTTEHPAEEGSISINCPPAAMGYEAEAGAVTAPPVDWWSDIKDRYPRLGRHALVATVVAVVLIGFVAILGQSTDPENPTAQADASGSSDSTTSDSATSDSIAAEILTPSDAAAERSSRASEPEVPTPAGSSSATRQPEASPARSSTALDSQKADARPGASQATASEAGGNGRDGESLQLEPDKVAALQGFSRRPVADSPAGGSPGGPSDSGPSPSATVATDEKEVTRRPGRAPSLPRAAARPEPSTWDVVSRGDATVRARYVAAVRGIVSAMSLPHERRWETGWHQYDLAASLCPEDPRYNHAWGLLLLKSGKCGEAIPFLRQAAERDYWCKSNVRHHLVLALVRTEQYEQAVAELWTSARIGRSEENWSDQEFLRFGRFAGTVMGYVEGMSWKSHLAPFDDYEIQAQLPEPAEQLYLAAKANVLDRFQTGLEQDLAHRQELQELRGDTHSQIEVERKNTIVANHQIVADDRLGAESLWQEFSGGGAGSGSDEEQRRLLPLRQQQDVHRTTTTLRRGRQVAPYRSQTVPYDSIQNHLRLNAEVAGRRILASFPAQYQEPSVPLAVAARHD